MGRQWYDRAPRTARHGRFEGNRGGMVCGWAWDAGAPHRPARLALLCRNGRSITVVAERYRADVQRAGYGDGYCGFALPLERLDPREPWHCVWADSGRPLAGGTQRLSECAPSRPSLRHGWLLSLDPPHRGDPRISGAVADPAQPLRRARLGLSRGGVLVEQVRACLYRAERPAGGDGFCGFEFQVPSCGARLELIELEQGRLLAHLRR